MVVDPLFARIGNNKQKEMWIVGEAVSFMQENNLTLVDSTVIAHLMDTFIPNEDMDNAIIATAIENLQSKVDLYL